MSYSPVINPMPVTGTFWQATQPVSGTVTATGPLTDTQLRATAVPVSGTVAVTGTFWQATQPVSGTVTANAGSGTFAVSAASLPLPTGAATETTLSAISAKFGALGQTTMTGSAPVVIASNQSAIPVTGTFWQATQPVSGTVTANAGTGTFAISAASLPLPTGAATSANQPTAAAAGSTTSGQTGALIMGAVTTAAPTYTTAQTNPISLTTLGGQRCDVSSYNGTALTGTVTAYGTAPTGNVFGVNASVTAVAAGTNAIGDVGIQYRASSTGGASAFSMLSPATPAATAVKASAGRLLGWSLVNSAAAVRSVKFWNTAVGSVTLGTTAALWEVDIPAGGRSEIHLPGGIAFATAITTAVTGGKGLTDNTGALGANDVSGVMFFA